MTATSIWLPVLRQKTDYAGINRPTPDLMMLHDHDSNTHGAQYLDRETGEIITFGEDLFGSDNRLTNLSHAWRHSSGYTLLHAYCKFEHYLSWHLGFIPTIHNLSYIRQNSTHLNPGVFGFRFQYRWPDTNDRNYWSNSPVHINDVMMHYYDAITGTMFSHHAVLGGSDAPDYAHPDVYVENDSRRSNTWRGAWYQVKNADARRKIINNQNFWVGLSVEMMYSERGTAAHSRCMDLRNLTPIYGTEEGSSYVPVITKPVTYSWNNSNRSAREIYT